MPSLIKLTDAETDYVQTLLMKQLIRLSSRENTADYKQAHRTVKDRLRNERKLIMNIAQQLGRDTTD